MRSVATAARSVLVAAFVVALAIPAQAAEPPITSSGQNLPPLSGAQSYQAGPGPAPQIRAYRSSGQWAADRTRIASEAAAFLDEWLTSCTQQADCRPAVVFDIDETLLTTYATFNRANFNPTPAQRASAQARCKQTRIDAVVELFRHAREAGANVYIITGRSERSRTSTTDCLHERGIAGWTQLIMRAKGQGSMLAADYKAAQRGEIEGQGFDIALSIGDQFSDVSGGHFAHGYVLPNPMSYIA